MGVDYYLVTKDDDRKIVLIVYLGGWYNDYCRDGVEIVDDLLFEIDEILEDEQVSDINNTRLNELTVGNLCKLERLVECLNKIKYDSGVSVGGDLHHVLKLYGLVIGLCSVGGYSWEIVSDYALFDGVIDELKKEGYDIWIWGD